MELIPGYCQGIIRVLIAHPADVIKIYMQTNPLTTIQTINKLWYSNPKIFFRGLPITLFITPIDRSIQYYIFEKLNNRFNYFISGLIVGSISSICTLPMQSLMSNMVVDENYNKNTMKNYIKTFIKKNSIRYLYKGFFVEMFRLSIFTSLYLGIYGNFRSKSNNHFMNGVTTSIISWTIMFPFDTIRTRLQTSQLNYKQISYKNLWRGLTPLLIRTVPSAGIGMYVYENVRKHLITKSSI